MKDPRSDKQAFRKFLRVGGMVNEDFHRQDTPCSFYYKGMDGKTYILCIGPGGVWMILDENGNPITQPDTTVEHPCPPEYLKGLELSYTSVATLAIAEGKARDSTDTYDIIVTSPLTAVLPGDLDTGSEGSDTWYAVYVIGDTSDVNSPDSLISESFTSPTLPAGYNVFRRIGVARNDGSSDLIPFLQRDDSLTRRYWWRDEAGIFEVLSGGTDAAFTPVDLSVFMPPVSDDAILRVDAGDMTYVHLRPTGSTVTDPIKQYGPGTKSPGPLMVQVEMPTNSSQSIDYHVSGGGKKGQDDASITVEGFYDEL